MSVYICEKCGCIDNITLGGYYKNALRKEPKMCSECNTGVWHNEFPKKHWSDYGIEALLEMEYNHDGSMINASKYLKYIGEMY